MNATAFSDGGVLALTGAAAAGSSTSRGKLQLDRALNAQPPSPAAYVSLDSLLEGAQGSDEAKSRLADILHTFGVVQGRVLQTSPDGSHQLDIGGLKVNLKLNAIHAPGETVLVAMNGGATAQAAPNTAAVTLSPAARLIASLLESTMPESANGTTESSGTTGTGTTAATAAPNASNTQELAAGLAQVLRSSGIFYESHLAGWIAGRMSLNDIRREPQARLAALTGATTGSDDAAGLPEGVGAIVSRQLDVLDQHAVRWIGLVWPGQAAEIRIGENTDNRQAEDSSAGETDGPAGSWSASIKMNMPSLGEVKARVTLAEGRISFRIQGSEDTSDALAQHRAELASALAARGLAAGDIRLDGDGDKP